MKRHILIVEDTKEISDMLSSFLEQNGFETTSVNNGSTASEIMKSGFFDLILMDLMLPYRSGSELINELRSYSDTPVIVLSAKSMMETRLEVLRLGADDYIIKPFDLNEVLVRIEVVLRRSCAAETEAKIFSSGKLCLNCSNNSVTVDGKIVSLTAKEQSLLRLFLENPTKVFTKANLYESVWQDTYYYEDNTINVHISNLRSKLKKTSGHDYIETVWGIGYRLKEE
ncbi:MAG: response regulator transcription factor [Huintestinicola sp.]